MKKHILLFSLLLGSMLIQASDSAIITQEMIDKLQAQFYRDMRDLSVPIEQVKALENKLQQMHQLFNKQKDDRNTSTTSSSSIQKQSFSPSTQQDAVSSNRIPQYTSPSVVRQSTTPQQCPEKADGKITQEMINDLEIKARKSRTNMLYSEADIKEIEQKLATMRHDFMKQQNPEKTNDKITQKMIDDLEIKVRKSRTNMLYTEADIKKIEQELATMRYDFMKQQTTSKQEDLVPLTDAEKTILIIKKFISDYNYPFTVQELYTWFDDKFINNSQELDTFNKKWKNHFPTWNKPMAEKSEDELRVLREKVLFELHRDGKLPSVTTTPITHKPLPTSTQSSSLTAVITSASQAAPHPILSMPVQNLPPAYAQTVAPQRPAVSLQPACPPTPAATQSTESSTLQQLGSAARKWWYGQ